MDVSRNRFGHVKVLSRNRLGHGKVLSRNRFGDHCTEPGKSLAYIMICMFSYVAVGKELVR